MVEPTTAAAVTVAVAVAVGLVGDNYLIALAAVAAAAETTPHNLA